VVIDDSYRDYGRIIALRNYSHLPVGCVFGNLPIRAIHVGQVSIILTDRTSGMINEPVETSQSYELYDVGTDFFPPKRPLTPEEKMAQAQKKAEAKIKALELDKAQASNGVAGAQCRLGLAYLKGQGVETNRFLAIEWLGKSAIQGNVEAQEALKKISEKTSTNSP
jgi:TPR repeat protein